MDEKESQSPLTRILALAGEVARADIFEAERYPGQSSRGRLKNLLEELLARAFDRRE